MSTCLLAIESSCDETAAAVVTEGPQVLSHIISSQIAIHRPYGGVVPEIASRKHLEAITEVTAQALKEADITWQDIDGIAVTQCPGLIGSLLVGVSYAKALSFALGKPLIAVHHLEGHMLAAFLEHPDLTFPFLALVVSGSHSGLIRAQDFGNYQLLGQSRDDAAGEAFDKIARALGLPYPGGPAIQEAAAVGQVCYDFPRAWLPETYDFSFSGLKSAVLNFLNQKQMKGESYQVADVAASAQEAIVDVLATKAAQAAVDLHLDTIVLAGGVAANQALRQKVLEKAPNKRLVYPSPIFCTDNAAMIGFVALHKYVMGDFVELDLNAKATAPLPFQPSAGCEIWG